MLERPQGNSDVIGALLSFTSLWDVAWKRALLCVVVGLGSFCLTAPIFLGCALPTDSVMATGAPVRPHPRKRRRLRVQSLPFRRPPEKHHVRQLVCNWLELHMAAKEAGHVVPELSTLLPRADPDGVAKVGGHCTSREQSAAPGATGSSPQAAEEEDVEPLGGQAGFVLQSSPSDGP